MKTYDLDVVVTRGDAVESLHRVHAAVVGPGDELIGKAGDSDGFTFWRSCAKPYQTLPFMQSGGFDSLGWGEEQLAIACGSHGGEPEHVALVENRLHNNCSGKHATMLAYAHQSGWPLNAYEKKDHPVQRAILQEVSLWTDVPSTKIVQAIDGCGAVVFGMTLERMARAYARFAASASRGEESPRRVLAAMAAQPFLVGGTDRADSILIGATGGGVISKIGAEGLHCAMIPERGIGLAVKVEDGSQRAQVPALVRLLQELDALPDGPPAGLCVTKPIRNTRGECVGEVMMRADAR